MIEGEKSKDIGGVPMSDMHNWLRELSRGENAFDGKELFEFYLHHLYYTIESCHKQGFSQEQTYNFIFEELNKNFGSKLLNQTGENIIKNCISEVYDDN